MTKMKHFAASFMVFGVIVTLFSGIWAGFIVGYDLTETNNKDGENIMERLSNINFIEGINELTNSIYNILAPSNVFDLLGALASAGTALLQTIGGIVLFPLDIFNAVSDFYPNGIPSAVSDFIGALVTLYVAFAILQHYTRTDA